MAFFSRTDLQDEDLSKMWRYAVPSGEHCMSKTHFINALKLVAVLQVRKTQFHASQKILFFNQLFLIILFLIYSVLSHPVSCVILFSKYSVFRIILFLKYSDSNYPVFVE